MSALHGLHDLSAEEQLKGWSVYLGALSRKAGVVIHFGTDRCETSGDEIWLPDIPLNMSFEDEMLFRANSEHECGHVVYSSFDYLKALKSIHPWARRFLNFVEDPWMEDQTCLNRPRAKEYFIEGAKILIARGKIRTGDQSAEDAVGSVLMYTGFVAFGRKEFGPMLDVAKANLVNLWGTQAEQVVDLITVLVSKRIRVSQITEDNGNIAKDVFQILRDYCQLLWSGPEHSRAIRKVSTLLGYSTLCEVLPGRSGLIATAENGEGIKTSIDHLSDYEKDQLASHIYELLKSEPSQDSPIDYASGMVQDGSTSESNGNRPAEESPENPDASGGLVEGTFIGTESMSDFTRDYGVIRSQISLLVDKLKKLLADKARKLSRVSYHGRKIKSGKLHRLVNYDLRIFKRETIVDKASVAVGLLADLSGSTANVCDSEIRQSAILFSAAFDQLNAPNAVWGFGTKGHENQVAAIKLFNWTFEKAKPFFGSLTLDAGGGTPLAQSLALIGPVVCDRSEKRKLIVVITDGRPANPELARDEVVKLQQAGCEVLHVVFGNVYEWLQCYSLPYITCRRPSDIRASIERIILDIYS